MSSYKDYNWSAGPTDAHSYIYPVLYELLSQYKDSRILDVGCGNGEIASKLICAGFNVYGIDASETGIKIASAKYPGRFFLQDIATGKLPSELSNIEFDVVISTEVIEHLYDPRSYIAFIKSVLEPKGGVLILSTPYHGYLKNLAMAISNKLDDHFTALWDGGHIKFWSKKTIRILLNEVGFRVIKYVGVGRIFGLWKSFFCVALISPGRSES